MKSDIMKSDYTKEAYRMRFFEDLQHISENRCPPRAWYIPYESLEKALMGERGLEMSERSSSSKSSDPFGANA